MVTTAALIAFAKVFGKEQLANPATAQSIASGFSDLKNSAQQIGQMATKLKSMFSSFDTAAPALTQLTSQLQSTTLGNQMNVMSALLRLSESEGVKVGFEALQGLVNGILNGGTAFIDGLTTISNIVGNAFTSSPYWDKVSTAFDKLKGQEAATLQSALTLLVNSITKLAENPLSVQMLDSALKNLNLAILRVTLVLDLLDRLFSKIEEKLDKIFGYPDQLPGVISTGGNVVIPSSNVPSTTFPVTKTKGYEL